MVRYNQITGVYDFLESDEKQDRPTPPTVDAHYTDAAQLAAWRQERG